MIRPGGVNREPVNAYPRAGRPVEVARTARPCGDAGRAPVVRCALRAPRRAQEDPSAQGIHVEEGEDR